MTNNHKQSAINQYFAKINLDTFVAIITNSPRIAGLSNLYFEPKRIVSNCFYAQFQKQYLLK